MSHLKEAESGRDMEGKAGSSWGRSTVYTVEELECKICYNRYDTRHRKPKVLSCLHRVCAKCLKKMVDMGESSSPSVICCPFCRHETHVPDEEVWLMEDDGHILAVLSCQQQDHRAPPTGEEVVLTPTSLTGTEGGESGGSGPSVGSADCLVITIMELPASSASSPSSSDSLSVLNMVRVYRPHHHHHIEATPTCNLANRKCQRSVPRCLLGALCLMYFSSLPLGIYLLMIQRMWMGVVLVSLVPSTLLLCVIYGFCQCVCTEILELVRTHTHART